MPRTIKTLLAMATLLTAAPLLARSVSFADPSDPNPSSPENYTQSPAPIEHGYADGQQHAPSPQNYQPPQNHTSQPAQGIWVVAAPSSLLRTISATQDQTELRLEHGLANVNVDHPADNSEITVDLPGGQVSLVKDGLYTFNADTNTIRVLRGEAVITSGNDHGIKVKEDHQFTFGADARAQEADPNQLRADLLQGNYGGDGYRDGYGYGYGRGFYGSPYGYGYPGYGFYGPGWGYPGYAYGPWGYPYGYGFGLGFGYYGGFRGGYYGGGYGYRGDIGAIRGGSRR